MADPKTSGVANEGQTTAHPTTAGPMIAGETIFGQTTSAQITAGLTIVSSTTPGTTAIQNCSTLISNSKYKSILRLSKYTS